MSMHTVKGYLFMSRNWSGDEWKPDLWGSRLPDNEGRIFLRELAIEVEAPDDFNPIPQQVAALEHAKAQALEEYQQRVAEINERLAKLLAITHEEA